MTLQEPSTSVSASALAPSALPIRRVGSRVSFMEGSKKVSPLDVITWRSILRTTCRGFASGFAVRGCAALLPRLLSPSSLLRRRTWDACFGKYAVNFGMFLGTMTGGYKLLRKLLPLLRGKDDQLNINIAAAISAGGVMFVPHLKTTIALYLVFRALDDYFRSKFRTGAIKQPKHMWVWLFCLSQMPINYFYCCDSRYLNQGYYRWVLSMGQLSQELVNYYYRSPWTFHQPTPGVFRPCQTLFHNGNCVVGNYNRFLETFRRAFKMYIGVHFIPVFVFRLKTWLGQPLWLTVITLARTLRSSLFLASYVMVMAVSQCTLRNIRQGDSSTHAMLGGFLAGLPLFLEEPSRRPELVLYVLPRAVEAIWNLVKSKFSPKSLIVRHVSGSLILMAYTMHLIMRNYTKAPLHMKRINHTIIDFLFGE